MNDTLIQMDTVSVGYPIHSGLLQRVKSWNMVLKDIDLSIYRGETLGLVGESGCGKTTLGRAILGLTPLYSGKISYHGRDHVRELSSLSPGEFRPLRKKLQIIFQDPYSSLNPRMRVGDLIQEGLRIHFPGESSSRHKERVIHSLEKVGLSSQILHRFPHEFSGGQRQRISIARAIVLEPEFIVCDESVSALDVSIQAQIINLLANLQKDMGLTYLFISHDLAVVRHISHRIAVIENGSIVELGETSRVTDNPQHPYTKKLLRAIPTLTAKR